MAENIAIESAPVNNTAPQEWIPTEHDLKLMKRICDLIYIYHEEFGFIVNTVDKVFMHLSYPTTCKHKDADLVKVIALDFNNDISYSRFIHVKMLELYRGFKADMYNITEEDIKKFFHDKWVEENPEIDAEVSAEVERLMAEAEAEAAEE